MTTIVFFLEEPSAREMIQGLLPRILEEEFENCRAVFQVFQGKSDLEKHLVRRLRGWRTPDSVFVVVRDQDAADCLDVKRNLVRLCEEAGRPRALVRIACRELESFYLGDLRAVERGLGIRGLGAMQVRSRFRNPDATMNPADELRKLTKGKYQQVAGSRDIAPFMSLSGNRSHSFQILITGIRGLVGAGT